MTFITCFETIVRLRPPVFCVFGGSDAQTLPREASRGADLARAARRARLVQYLGARGELTSEYSVTWVRVRVKVRVGVRVTVRVPVRVRVRLRV